MEVTIKERERNVPVQGRYNIVVCGGGTAGVYAALAAAREGARTIVIERYGFLGGNSVTGLPALSFFGPEGKQIVAGLAQEVIDQLIKLGASPGHVLDPRWNSLTLYNPDMYRLVICQMLHEQGVQILLHSYIVGTVMEGKKRIKGIIVENKSGRQAILGDIFVDSTGDADVAADAGAPFHQGRPDDGLTQPPTLVFRMGNFDKYALADYLDKNPSDFRGLGEGWTTERIRENNTWAFCGLHSLIKEFNDVHNLGLPRTFICFNTSHRPGEVFIVAIRVINFEGTNADDISRAEVESQRQVYELARLLVKFAPGFKDAYITDVAHQIGVRETRRLIGAYELTASDVGSGRRFPDCVAKGGWPIDIHSPNSKKEPEFKSLQSSYDIPYRCIYSPVMKNLLVAGRPISTSHEAHASTRVMPCCFALGQAAGTAAALAVKAGQDDVSKVDISRLKERLQDNGAIID